MSDIYRERRERLQKILCEQGISAAIFDDRIDQFYFSGTMQSNYLVVPAVGEGFQMTRKAQERLIKESPWLEVYTFRNTRDILTILAEHGLEASAQIGLNFDVTTMNNGERWRKMLPKTKTVDIGQWIKTMRRIKDDQELALLRRAGEALRSVPDWAEEALRAGRHTELAVAAEIEYRLRNMGHAGLIRLSRAETETVIGLVAAGENANVGSRFEGVCAGSGLGSAAPFGPSRKTIAPGEPVSLDYVMNDQGYHVDQTRMISWTDPSNEVKRAYEDMMEILELLEAHLRPGALPEDLYALANQEAERRGLGPYFMGYGGEKVYFVGHGIGLTLDEEPFIAPRYNVPLEAGMVIALEPKVMLPGVGVIGVEDTYIVTDEQAERITVADRCFRVVK